MKIEINLDKVDLEDWIDWNGEDTSVPTLSEGFLAEIKNSIISQLMTYDFKFRVYEYIDAPIQDMVNDFVNNGAMKQVVEQRIKEKPLYNNTLTYWESYRDTVQAEVDIYSNKIREEIQDKLQYYTSQTVRNSFDDVFKNLKMAEYINQEKLALDVLKILEERAK